MVAEDSEEGNACKRELDEMCKAPASTKKKDDACMLIFQFFSVTRLWHCVFMLYI